MGDIGKRIREVRAEERATMTPEAVKAVEEGAWNPKHFPSPRAENQT